MNEKNYLRSMLVLCGYGFGENGPFIEYDDWHDGGLRKQLALLDNTKYIRFYSSRYCPGSFNLAKLKGQPCNELTPIELPSFNSCKTCFDKTGFNPAFYHMNKSEISPQQRTYNNEAHKVYLAWFSQGLMKVGISNSRRIETCWLEQGARAAVQV